MQLQFFHIYKVALVSVIIWIFLNKLTDVILEIVVMGIHNVATKMNQLSYTLSIGSRLSSFNIETIVNMISQTED